MLRFDPTNPINPVTLSPLDIVLLAEYILGQGVNSCQDCETEAIRPAKVASRDGKNSVSLLLSRSSVM